jgi:Mrp family chromosome partitioning ATPase/capsular polysaccharide biosynthesis protein
VIDDGRRGTAEPSILKSIWRHRLLVALGIAVAMVAGVVMMSLRPPTYAAEAGVLLEDPRLTIDSERSAGRDEVRYVADQVAILKSPAALQRASELTRTSAQPAGMGIGELQRATAIRTTEGSNYVVIRVTASDPRKAQLAANSLVAAYREIVRARVEAEAEAALRELGAAIEAAARLAAVNPTHVPVLNELRARRARVQVDAQLSGDGVALLAEAEPGSRQAASLFSTLIVTLVLGGLIGIGLAYLLEAHAIRVIRSTTLAGVPVLGEIPPFSRDRVRSALPVVHAPHTRSTETFRFLAAILALPRTTLADPDALASSSVVSEQPPVRASGPRVPPSEAERRSGHALPAPVERDDMVSNRSIAFVGVRSGDGATTVAANCALAAAQAGDRVLAADADFRGQGLARLLVGEGQFDTDEYAPEGLTDFLVTGLIPPNTQRAYMSSGGSLTLVAPGSMTIAAMNMLQPARVRATLDATRDEFERVFVDLPPLLDFPYAVPLLTGLDAVVLVVSSDTEDARLEEGLEHLASLGVRPVGLVRTPPRSRSGYVRRLLGAPLRAVDRVIRRRRPAAKPLFPQPQHSQAKASPVKEKVSGEPSLQTAADDASRERRRRWA